jgi:hypothetical protein
MEQIIVMVAEVAGILVYLEHQLHRPTQYSLPVVVVVVAQAALAPEIKAEPEVDNLDKLE